MVFEQILSFPHVSVLLGFSYPISFASRCFSAPDSCTQTHTHTHMDANKRECRFELTNRNLLSSVCINESYCVPLLLLSILYFIRHRSNDVSMSSKITFFRVHSASFWKKQWCFISVFFYFLLVLSYQCGWKWYYYWWNTAACQFELKS